MATTNSTHDQVPNSSHTPLFSQVHYHIINSQGLPSDLAEKFTHILNENGAVEHAPPSIHGRVPLNGATHIISTTIDFEEYEAISNALIPVVKPEWIASSIAKKKLANPRSHSPDPRLIFSGLVVSCADLPEGDKDAIVGGVLAMGGLYSPPITKLVTHLVALNMDPEKCRTAVAKNLKCKLVLPHWFDDCLRLGKRIDEGPYVLPDPEIHRLRFGERIPDACRPDLQGALSAHPGHLPVPSGSPSSDRQDLSVFLHKRIMLSKDLEIASHLRETIEGVIRYGGGTITTSAEKSDIVVCHYRDGEEYKLGSRAGKVVGNLPWLYHLITHNTWTSPLRRLLHYPIARKGLPGFRKFRISLSNYNGEARIYLENLAKAAGCEFTKTMKMDNTHLITAHTFSEKCEAAKEWNINMINHLWLEESYAKWEIQSLTNPRYTHFPPRTNLSEVVGQTPIDKKAIERHFFPEVLDTQIETDNVGPPTEPVEQEVKDMVTSRISVSAAQPSSSSADGIIGSGTKELAGSTPKAPKQDRPLVDGAMLKTPTTLKLLAEGKENETPSTSSSRGAKDRAVARLHDLAPDIALYEKEKKRVGGVIFGGRKTSIEMKSDSALKRSLSGDDDSTPDERESVKAAKRVKKGRDPPIIRLLLTGYNNWVGDVRRENEARGRLRDLGILVTQDPTNCTHLAAPRILRTPKFLCAMAYSPVLLSTLFVDDCLTQNALPPLEGYRLEDLDGESRHEVNLAEVTIRAKANKCRLLHNDVIYCTEHVHGGFEAYKSIIEANGGRCLLYRARAGSVAFSKFENAIDATESEHTELEHVYLISGMTPKDARLWPKFREMVQAIGKCPRIVKNDWILDVALSQEMRWKDTYEMTDADIKGDT